MYFLYVVGFFMVLATYFVSANEDGIHQSDLTARIETAHLLTYHQAALDYCKTVTACDSDNELGNNAVRNHLSEMEQGSRVFISGRYRSYTDNSGLVITVDTREKVVQAQRVKQGRVNYYLQKAVDNSMGAGGYDASANEVRRSRGAPYSVPASMSGWYGLTLEDNQSVVVSDRTP